jgi:ribosomal protein S18 acetylase RimI-like enzyme
LAAQLTDRCEQDRPEVEAFLEQHNTRIVARDGVLVDALEHPAVLARAGDELCGVATYVVEHDDCELLTLHTTIRHAGIGTALLDAVRGRAVQQGCGRIRVVTTNDNLDALRFYQRRGFGLTMLRPAAVDRSRETLKPQIPETGAHGIRLRDELELEMELG